MSDAADLQQIVAALADGASVDWDAADAAAPTQRRRVMLRHLQVIAAVTDAGVPASPPSPAPIGRGIAFLYGAVVVVAAIKIAMACAGGLRLIAEGAWTRAEWPYAINLGVFTAGAAALLLGSGRDARARSLGLFFLIVASAFADRFLLPGVLGGMRSGVIDAVLGVPTDAFVALALWLFVWWFPAVPLGATDRRVTKLFLRLSFAAAIVLVVATVTPAAPGTAFAAAAGALDRRAPAHSYYWLVLFGMVAPALPHLVWKSRFETAGERRRAALFTLAFAAGVTPIVLAVIVSSFTTLFDDPATRAVVGVFLYASLLSIVPMTAYAVRVHRVMDLHLIVTRTMQRSAIRHLVWIAGMAPFLALAFYFYVNRHRTISDIVSRQKAILLVPLPLLGLLALTFRSQLLQAIDRRFLGAPHDYPEVLGRLQRELRESHGARDVSALLAREIDRAIHPRIADVLLVDPQRRMLTSLGGPVASLPAESTLGRLLRVARAGISAGIDLSGPVRRLLPADDQGWLTESGIELLVPLFSSRGELIAVMALGGKRSGLPFADDDRLLLATIAAHGAMVLENRTLHDRAFGRLAHAPADTLAAIDWDDEPGALCPGCRIVWPSRTLACSCGSPTTSAPLPLVLRGKLHVERLIGSGGMGVVYLATDLALDRKVAIKTLPRLAPDRAVGLQREARAMASVRHPNLAMIFGVETWRGAPMLVVEYLEGGTLADRLLSHAMPLGDVLELGIVLADVLDRLHGSGVLHCDIKPTNIGYTREGAAKLMDFGVARFVRAPDPPVPGGGAAVPIELAADAPMARSLTWADHIGGTPLYLSPEAIAGEPPDRTFDLWSLSVVLFEALTGCHPFRADSLEGVFARIRRSRVQDVRDFVRHCPEATARMFARSLSVVPDERPHSAAELRNWLRVARSGLDG